VGEKIVPDDAAYGEGPGLVVSRLTYGLDEVGVSSLVVLGRSVQGRVPCRYVRLHDIFFRVQVYVHVVDALDRTVVVICPFVDYPAGYGRGKDCGT